MKIEDTKAAGKAAVDQATMEFCNMGMIRTKCPYCGKKLVRIVVGGLNKICCENGCVEEAWV